MSQQVPRKAIHKVEAWQPAPASAVASVPASSAHLELLLEEMLLYQSLLLLMLLLLW